jgi:formate dehydrogenase subunit gamma
MSQAMMKSGGVKRHAPHERVNHWIVAILWILLACSGLAFFHPSFYFLANLLGGGPWARILHPFLGVAFFAAFFLMMLRYWADNKIQPCDREWAKHLGDFINNRDDRLPEIDKYNIGQKRYFWVAVVSTFLLLLSGIVMWRPYFAGAFPIVAVRIAAVVHAVAAFVLILGVISHIYAGVFWVRGTLRAMTRGDVSHGWARGHHALWYKRVTGNR